MRHVLGDRQQDNRDIFPDTWQVTRGSRGQGRVDGVLGYDPLLTKGKCPTCLPGAGQQPVQGTSVSGPQGRVRPSLERYWEAISAVARI